MPKLINLLNQKFGRWLVIEQSSSSSRGKARWLCKCDCGTEKVVQAQSLLSGDSTSCGCWNKEALQKRVQKESGESSYNAYFQQYKDNARNKNRVFSLTREEFNSLTQSSCFYCGEPPSLFYKKPGANGGVLVNGIDRRDNAIGYTIENSVTCCKVCNMMKRDMDEGNFISHIEKILVNKQGNNYD